MTIAMLMNNCVETYAVGRKEHEMRALRSKYPDDQMICPVCGAEVQIVPDIPDWMMTLTREVRRGRLKEQHDRYGQMISEDTEEKI